MRDDNKYLINARWSLGSKRKKLFFVFMIGKDRRLEKLPSEKDRRQHTSFGKAIVYSGIFAWVFTGFLCLSIASLYIGKTWMGIDLLKGGSPIPKFLEEIRLCHRTALTDPNQQHKN